MAIERLDRRTVLILLEEPHAWLAAATFARQAPGELVEALIAPVPGVDFLSAQGREGAELDRWWARMATAAGRPVVLAAHEPALPDWIPGLDADFVIAVPDDDTLNVYRHLPNVFATVDDDPRQLAELALRGMGLASTARPGGQLPGYATATERPARERPELMPPPAARPIARPVREAVVPPVAPPPIPPPLPQPQPISPAVRLARPERATSSRPAILDPFELLSRAEPVQLSPIPEGRNGMAGQGPGAPGRPAPLSRRTLLGERAAGESSPASAEERQRPQLRPNLDPRQFLERIGQGRRPPVSPELGQAILTCKPIVTAVVSRKGGVGKTASAAAVAAILGEAVDPFGHTAALVDANVGNPDAWGRLDMRGAPITMRDVVRSLMAGIEPPSAAYAETPALAVYPEARDAGDGYAPAQIQRVAAYLRSRHSAVVVDLPNRLPAFTSAEAAVAAAWIGEADVLVLPTTADPTALLGAIEYLDADSVQGKPVIVSYIVPRVRQIRDAPQVRGLLDRIRASVAAVVEVPDDDRATLALVRRVAITEVGNQLRQAYVKLATQVVEAAANRHGAWG